MALICPACGAEQSQFNRLCIHCGAALDGSSPPRPKRWRLLLAKLLPADGEDAIPWDWQGLLLPEPQGKNGWEVLPELILLGLLVVGSLPIIFGTIDHISTVEAYLHLPNLIFHEAGHVFFGFFGQFIGSLGGTLGQLLMPLLCFHAFLVRQRHLFSAAVVFWWFGQNFVDIAPYIKDASVGELPLLGGNIGKHAPYGFHDWEYLLTETGLIAYDQAIALTSHLLGIGLMVLALVWAAAVVARQCSSSG